MIKIVAANFVILQKGYQRVVIVALSSGEILASNQVEYAAFTRSNDYIWDIISIVAY